MKHPSILLFVGTLILLVSQHEVQARNYLLWALGLEDDTSQGRRQLKPKGNLKTRERIRENRQVRREERQRAAAAPTKSSKAVNKRDGGAAGKNKKQKKTSTSRNFLRAKVAEKVADERKSNIVKVSVKDAGGGGGGKAKKKNNKVTTRTIDGGGGGGGKEKKQNGNAKQREKEAHFEKKKFNHLQKKEKAAEDRTFKEMGEKGGGSLMIDVRDADTSAARIERADKAAAAKNNVGERRGTGAGGKRNKKDASGPEKVVARSEARSGDVGGDVKVERGGGEEQQQQKLFGLNGHNSAQHLANQRTYLIKLANHREHQADEVIMALDRTFTKPGRAKPGRIERGRGASPEMPEPRKNEQGGRGASPEKPEPRKNEQRGRGASRENPEPRNNEQRGRGASPEKPEPRKAAGGGSGGGMGGGMGGGGGAAARKGVSGERRSGADQQTHRHKRGFNHRKAERINKQHARHEARGRTDKVTLKDGRGGGAARRGMM